MSFTRLASSLRASPRLSSPRAFSTSPISRFSQSAAKMGVTELETSDAFKAQVTDAKGPVIVDYFATWCGPCKAISPVLEQLSEKHTHINFFKVDVDKLNDVAADNGISAMPTFQFYNNGELVELVRGANPQGIQGALAKLL